MLVSEGVRDRKHLSEKLKTHENSVEHLTNMNTWNELRQRLRENKTIDDEMQREIAREKERWRQVLVRIVAAVKFLAKNKLAFQDQMRNSIKLITVIFLGLLKLWLNLIL